MKNEYGWIRKRYGFGWMGDADVSNSFAIIVTPLGTSPVADDSNDTLTLTSTNSTIDITGTSGTDSINFDLASVISAAGPIGSATVAPIITYDAMGRLTTVTSATITPAASSITGGAALNRTNDTNVTMVLSGTPSTALLNSVTMTLGWTGSLTGGRGGTGVNNAGKTITLGGNLVTSGAFDLTLTQTATTNVTLPTTGTLSTLAGSETLTNKTIGVTQLNGSTYTMAVNNTGSTANYTEITYKDPGSQTYAGTITWTGTTAPSGSLTQTYYWRQIGKEVKLDIAAKYTVAGAANTAVSFTLPTDCPAPVEWNGFGAASEKVWTGYGYVDAGATGAPPACRIVMGVNASDTGYLVSANFGSQSALVAMVTVIYRTT